MGSVTVKNFTNNYENSPAIKNLLRYVVSKKGTDEYVDCWGTKGLLKDINHAYKVINRMQRYLRCDNGKRMFHFVISFPVNIKSQENVFIVADAIASYLGEEYQLVYGIHCDTDNYHIHFAMNSVSYVTGKKWHKENHEFARWFQNLRNIAQRILDEASDKEKIIILKIDGYDEMVGFI